MYAQSILLQRHMSWDLFVNHLELCYETIFIANSIFFQQKMVKVSLLMYENSFRGAHRKRLHETLRMSTTKTAFS